MLNRAQRRARKALTGDKGPMTVMMANRDGQVIIEFANTLKWFSMGKTETQDFIKKLQYQLDNLDKPDTEEQPNE